MKPAEYIHAGVRLLFLVTQCAYLRLIGEYVQISWDFDDFGNGVNKRITGHFAIFREENIWSNVYFSCATAAELNDADNPHGCWFDRTIKKKKYTRFLLDILSVFFFFLGLSELFVDYKCFRYIVMFLVSAGNFFIWQRPLIRVINRYIILGRVD